MSSYNLLNLGTQALQANSSALGTVGQNISNVNTEGYSRQVVSLTTVQYSSGVQVESIDRITDRFLTEQMWSDVSTYNQSLTYSAFSSRLDDLLATDSTSISSALDSYFSALQNVVDDPTSTPNRELFIAEADALVQRFNNLDASLQTQNVAINDSVEDLADQVNSLTTNIAELNYKIKVGTAANRPINELEDQREELINQLSELVGVDAVEQDGNQISLFVGNGQPLVVGGSANRLSAIPGDPDASQTNLALTISNNEVDVTDQLSGGQIGGALKYREEALNDARDELGRVAILLSESMNEAHQSGIDLNNDLGGLIFSDVNSAQLQRSRVLADSDNRAQLEDGLVEIDDLSQIQASEYTVLYEGDNRITLTRESDGKVIRINDLQQVSDPYDVEQGSYYLNNSKELVFAVDGMKVTLSTDRRMSTGDEFVLQPVRTGAEDMNLEIQDGDHLALASPIRVVSDTENTGSGVTEVAVTDFRALSFDASGELAPPLSIVFNNADPVQYTVYDMTDSLNPQPYSFDSDGDGTAEVLENIPYTAGDSIQLKGFEATITGQPKAGDRFSISFNEDGISDNRNALIMSDLQEADVSNKGAYQDLYGSLLERVGTRTSTAQINLDANKAVLTSTSDAKASVSGVNLDEEAAKLVQFQQAYQASAQLISTSQTLFDTLLSSL
ncbi:MULTISPECIES: flagellar hook-associated protein FlgK [Neptunomonas]|uniref:flagellar hook-associated protein FlgK n=1 Tax=Neptunomonas TaxID=75687 RepID=UPI0015BFE7D2|nr:MULTISPECIES: flagellar hook-associated protein FlgK [Neptunomonas]MBT3144384.1 flagellar hook-associated protein FlgK [Neptunomonas phycophila]MDN2660530.1 flagellar hook-associated protein FlgK [Neptunomonas sp. CHC150]QLE96701.1 flagellar hook-associated protein FlgK [Neptunomonas phycophila]